MFSILSHEYNRLKVLIADERAMVSPVARVIAADDSLIPGWMDIADKVYKALTSKSRLVVDRLVSSGSQLGQWSRVKSPNDLCYD